MSPSPALRAVEALLAERDAQIVTLRVQQERTQEWLEKFQGVAAAKELEVHALRDALREARVTVQSAVMISPLGERREYWFALLDKIDKLLNTHD